MNSPSAQPASHGSTVAEKQFHFLGTKVVPPRYQGLIERPRLLGIASQLSGKRLAVVKGPAGFGKTSLAASWVQRLEQDGNAVAWLAIDTDDDEPASFLFYLSHALQRAVEGVGAAALQLIRESSLIKPRTIVSILINDLADVDDDVYLFLEDFHWITNPELHEALANFLRRSPSHCHVVLTTRTEPPLPIASFRAQNQLLEIAPWDLRFDVQETRNLLEADSSSKFVPADIRLLHEKTEGWPAALRIAVSTAIQSKQNFGDFVRHLSGAQRPIGAYLEDMFEGLPRELFQFMLRTSILDRLCAPLCDAVTGGHFAQEALSSIERLQLLLAPIDQVGRWYRYHPLLVEYMTQKLQSELGDEIPELHQRAALWYASQELWTEAVQHAIAAGDEARARGWIANCAMVLVKRGDLFTLLGWQRQLPTIFIRSQPEVRVAIAWALSLALRFDEAIELVGEIEADLDANASPDDRALRCECRAIRAVALGLKDDSEGARSIAEECLSQSTDPWTANVASNVVRFSQMKRGILKEFYATPWIPYSLDDDRRNVFAAVYYRCIQGLADFQQLRIPSAERYYLDALRLAEEHVGPNSIAAALPASLIARIRYEQNRFDEAEALLIDRIPLINAGAMLECVLSSYLVAVRVALHRMNLERAHTLLERAENQGHARGWGRLTAVALLERLRLCLKEGRTEEAAEYSARLERLAVAYPAPTNCSWSDIRRYATWARACILSDHDRSDEAISILNGLRLELREVHNLQFALRVETHLSIVQFKSGRAGEALECFESLINLLARAGIYRTILDEGAEVGPLILALQKKWEKLSGADVAANYLSNLSAAWGSHHQSERPPTPISPIADALSTREGDILKLIADGLSNKEIARNLSIAPETVKSHVKHIFTKLNVEKRAQAVSRAQTLGLVGTPR